MRREYMIVRVFPTRGAIAPASGLLGVRPRDSSTASRTNSPYHVATLCDVRARNEGVFTMGVGSRRRQRRRRRRRRKRRCLSISCSMCQLYKVRSVIVVSLEGRAEKRRYRNNGGRDRYAHHTRTLFLPISVPNGRGSHKTSLLFPKRAKYPPGPPPHWVTGPASPSSSPHTLSHGDPLAHSACAASHSHPSRCSSRDPSPPASDYAPQCRASPSAECHYSHSRFPDRPSSVSRPSNPVSPPRSRTRIRLAGHRPCRAARPLPTRAGAGPGSYR